MAFKIFGEVLKKNRLKQNLTLFDVAKAINTSPQFVKNMESGKSLISSKKLHKLAKTLDIEVDVLLNIVTHELVSRYEMAVYKVAK